MEIKEYFNYRTDLLDESKDEDGFISESEFLNICLPGLNETKLTDTEECNECFCSIDKEQLKINGYVVNESEERLQTFIINEDSLELNRTLEQISISQKSYYDKQFNRTIQFLKKAIKKQLDDLVQDSSPAKPLIAFLGSAEGIDQIDVIEIFLISATVTVESRGESPQPRRLDFENDSLKVSFTKHNTKIDKEVTIIKRLVDLNFLYNVVISQGNREALQIDFSSPPYNYKIKCIQAANEMNFESFLCVLPGYLLAELYKWHSSRMLEKNVRSFLQLNNSVNKGMQETIRKSPEKFIAYNNGLTITATGKELVNENGTLYINQLTDFQIVNGGQTTATIYFSKKNGLDIRKINVMAKINVAKDATDEDLEDLISNISSFSNAQSKVSKVDLRSRSSQLMKLKSLSESILTPSGNKWFFERAKGEFNTIIRKKPQHKNRINREYPKERRFTKEELAKYYTSWGDTPYLVKKGGEKIFRFFIEDISGDTKKTTIEIDRLFYENLIAKILLFRTLEKIYGAGPSSIGQIRSAVVPYSISILYKHTSGNKKSKPFDLFKIWKSESLDEDLAAFFTSLMVLMNDLIKKYAKSEDYGEYSKKKELWDSIWDSREIREFLHSKNSIKIFDKYCASEESIKKRKARNVLIAGVDFQDISEMVDIFENTDKFYKKVLSEFSSELKDNEEYKIEQIIHAIKTNSDITKAHLEFEHNLIRRIRNNNPEFFDKASLAKDSTLKKTLDFILLNYNRAIENNLNIISEFALFKELARKKGVKLYTVFDDIGKALNKGKAPTIRQIILASEYVNLIKKSD